MDKIESKAKVLDVKPLITHSEIHAAVAPASESRGKSINQWAARVLDKASHTH